jgi:membrane protein DedA with SNARE-associated domain
MSKTFLGYELGKYLYKKFNHHNFFRYIQKRVYNTLPKFKKRPFWSIFISKFIMGLNYMVVLFSGYEKIDYRKYLKAEISSTFVWAPTLLTLGYFFGYTAFNISREIWQFTLVVVILLALFIIFDKLIGWLYEIFEEFYDNDIK